MKYLRRGKATADVFARARRATESYSSFHVAEKIREIPVAKVEEVFLTRPKCKLERRSENHYVFIDPNPWGIARYELFL